jgi:hypothetical protein
MQGRHERENPSSRGNHIAIPWGTKLGSYEVDAQFGACGIGEVYSVHDTKLRGAVAIKSPAASLHP